jgi:hypothetical protein
MAAFDKSAPMGSISPLATGEFSDLVGLSADQLSEELSVIEAEMVCAEAALTSDETTSEDDRKFLLETWDQMRQWRVAVLNQMKAALKSAIEALDKELEANDDLRIEAESHDEMAALDAEENRLFKEQAALERRLAALEQEIA